TATSFPAVAQVYSSSPQRVIANNGVLYASSQTRLTDITDGTSNQFLLGETAYFHKTTNPNTASYPATWASAGIHVNVATPTSGIQGQVLTVGYGKPDPNTGGPSTGGCGATLTAVVNGLNSVLPPGGFCVASQTQGSYHPGGAWFAMCDG